MSGVHVHFRLLLLGNIRLISVLSMGGSTGVPIEQAFVCVAFPYFTLSDSDCDEPTTVGSGCSVGSRLTYTPIIAY